MFNEHSIIKDVNVINKLVCYCLVIIALILCNQAIFMIFINIFLLLITKQFTKLWKMNVVTLIISVISIFYSQILWISKLGIFILYTILFKKVTKAVELRYLLEKTLYCFQTKRITYYILYVIYFIKNFKNNIKSLWLLKDDYSISLSFSFLKFIIKQGYLKTKLQMQDFIEMNKLRFYNFYKTRTYIEKVSFESWDTNYLVSHAMILLLTCFYGR